MEDYKSSEEWAYNFFKSGGLLIDKIFTGEVTWEEAWKNPAFRILSKRVKFMGWDIKELYDSGFRYISGDGLESPVGIFTER